MNNANFDIIELYINSFHNSFNFDIIDSIIITIKIINSIDSNIIIIKIIDIIHFYLSFIIDFIRFDLNFLITINFIHFDI